MDKLLSRQLRLYEAAHSDSLELKPLAYRFRQRGIDTTKLYVNPRFLPIPWDNCPHMSNLDRSQISRITACYFALNYAGVLRAETRAVSLNIDVSERAFPRYSDNYMVLLAESNEELDHVAAFRCICQAVLDGIDPVWRTGEPLGTSFQDDPAYGPLIQALQQLEASVCPSGYGALYLLHRYLLNLGLKRNEGFMQVFPKGGRHSIDECDPLALEIVHGHGTDEARHFVTSQELGLELLERARPDSRASISKYLSFFIKATIEREFGGQRQSRSQDVVIRQTLAAALQAPEFEGFALDAQQLLDSWTPMEEAYEERDELSRARRWMAREMISFIERTGIKLQTWEALERMQGCAVS